MLYPKEVGGLELSHFEAMQLIERLLLYGRFRRLVHHR